MPASRVAAQRVRRQQYHRVQPASFRRRSTPSRSTAHRSHMTLGTRLKSARTQRGLSLRDVESQTGISNGYLSQLESDSVKTPSPRHLYSLSQVYEIAYGEVMELAGYVVPDVRNDRPRPQGLAFDAGYLTLDEEQKVAAYAEGLRAAREGHGAPDRDSRRR